MVERGLSSRRALLAATRDAAVALGREADLGSLEPGKLADLIAVDGDPEADVRLLQDQQRIPLVMLGGRLAVDRRPVREPVATV
jgi:imidazolonepropionase-like amidohydrolase